MKKVETRLTKVGKMKKGKKNAPYTARGRRGTSWPHHPELKQLLVGDSRRSHLAGSACWVNGLLSIPRREWGTILHFHRVLYLRETANIEGRDRDLPTERASERRGVGPTALRGSRSTRKIPPKKNLRRARTARKFK